MSFNNSSFNRQRNYMNNEMGQGNPYKHNKQIKSKYARFNNAFNNATEYRPELQNNNHQRFNQPNNHMHNNQIVHNNHMNNNHMNNNYMHNNPRINNNNQQQPSSNNASNFFKNQDSNKDYNNSFGNKKLDIDAETERNNSFAYITLALGLLLVTVIFIVSVAHQKKSGNDNQDNKPVVEATANSIEETQDIVDITATDTPLSFGDETTDMTLDGSQEDVVDEPEESSTPTPKPTTKPTQKPTAKPTTKPKATTKPVVTSAPTQAPAPTINTSIQTVNESHVAYTLNLSQTSGIIYPNIKGTANVISEGVLRYYDSALGRNVDKYWRIQLNEYGEGSTGIMLTNGVSQYQFIILKTTLIGTANANISSSLTSYEIR